MINRNWSPAYTIKPVIKAMVKMLRIPTDYTSFDN